MKKKFICNNPVRGCPHEEKCDEVSESSSNDALCDADYDVTLKHKLLMAQTEAEDHRRAATRLADALQLIYNDVGEICEVVAGYETVEYDVSNYQGLDG